ncbi:MAG TPA: hypothetical protein VI197_05845 [Polyangiaceae bacterium]
MAIAPVRHLLPVFAFFATVMLQAHEGAASQNFPGEIRDTLQLDCTPTCLLCHKSLEGGSENLNAYGEDASKNRLVMQTPAVFFAADGYAATSNFDKDSEGKTDRDEIIANTDPSSTADLPICSEAIYGCGAAQMAPGGTPRTSLWALVAACGVAAFLLRQLRV